MRVYLVRHGDAVSEIVDPKRPLSERGRREVGVMVEELMSKEGVIRGEKAIRIEKIFHSGKRRAEETAEIVKERLLEQNFPDGGSRDNTVKIQQRDGLMPGDDYVACAQWLNEMASIEAGDLMLVGHLPFMGYLVNELTGKNEDVSNDIGTANCVVLELDKGDKWVIEFLIKPEVS